MPQKKLNARPGAMSSNNSTGKVMNRSEDDNAALASGRGAIKVVDGERLASFNLYKDAFAATILLSKFRASEVH